MHSIEWHRRSPGLGNDGRGARTVLCRRSVEFGHRLGGNDWTHDALRKNVAL